MRKLLVLVAALAFVGGACGSDGDKKANAAELKKMLLTLDDLPSGFEVDESSETDDPSAEDEEDDNLGCTELDALETKYRDATDAKAEVTFAKETDEAYQSISESVEQYTSLDVADESFDATVDAINACEQFDSTDEEGTRTSGTMEPLEFPKLNDDTFAAHMTITQTSGDESATFGGDIVAVRDGDRVATVFVLSVGEDPITKSAFESLVRKAADRL